MNIKPEFPGNQAARQKAIHAALITNKCLAKTRLLEAAGEHSRAKATFNGLIGYLVSQSTPPEHLTWARFALRCHADGGHA